MKLSAEAERSEPNSGCVTDLTRWEQGSDFALPIFDGIRGLDCPWQKRAILTGSGRSALEQLLDFGREKRGWKRLWVPYFFCQDVIPSLRRTGLEILGYEATPLAPQRLPVAADLDSCDVILIVNFYGLGHNSWEIRSSADRPEIIEDHTHDPASDWASQSKADWCVASLRKTLPLPDGGVIWSPAGHPLPPEPALTSRHCLVAARRLAAMSLKSLYLAGEAIAKDDYRRLFLESEREIAGEGVSGISPWSRSWLSTLPVHEWREARRKNHEQLRELLTGIPGVTVLAPENPTKAAPAVCTILLESRGQRDALRHALLEARVYSAILWPLAADETLPAPSSVYALSERLLSFQCDMRYSPDDMRRVASAVRDKLALSE